jgi:hypothetical protein
MGREDLFRRRKGKSANDLARRAPKRRPYDKVLIVCEGCKTEPIYFNSLKSHYALDTANVTVSGDCGSDPMSVVKHGRDLYRAERQKGDPYDRVYCVFDGDVARVKYDEALSTIRAQEPKDTFFGTTSVPCFEYWFLLHFHYTTAPYEAVGGVSAGNAMKAELRVKWPEYKEGLADTFVKLLDRLDQSIANAKRVLAEAKRNRTDNPSTRVHELVEYLQNIKSSK